MTLVLALDLEGTLISNAVSQFPRPGLHAFLDECRALFPRIVMYTAIKQPRFESIAQLLVSEGCAPGWFPALECVDWAGEVKDLRYVEGADVESVMLVDDIEAYVHADQRRQWVPVAPYDPANSDDAELARVLEVLRRRLDRTDEKLPTG